MILICHGDGDGDGGGGVVVCEEVPQLDLVLGACGSFVANIVFAIVEKFGIHGCGRDFWPRVCAEFVALTRKLDRFWKFVQVSSFLQDCVLLSCSNLWRIFVTLMW